MSYGKKGKFGKAKEAVSSAFRKAAMVTLAAGAFIGAPGWYYYGTVQEQEVKINSITTKYKGWDDKTFQGIYEYRIVTNKGAFKNEDTYTHLKFDSSDLQERLQQGQTYKIKSYGYRFSLPFSFEMYPNIVNATLVTEDEMKERQKAKDAADKQNTQKNPQQGAASTPSAASSPQPQAALSGNMTTVEMIADGQRIQMTVPVEVIGKVTVHKVSPLQQAAPTAPAPVAAPPAPAPAPKPVPRPSYDSYDGY
jgi:hypothetical protein